MWRACVLQQVGDLGIEPSMSKDVWVTARLCTLHTSPEVDGS